MMRRSNSVIDGRNGRVGSRLRYFLCSAAPCRSVSSSLFMSLFLTAKIPSKILLFPTHALSFEARAHYLVYCFIYLCGQVLAHKDSGLFGPPFLWLRKSYVGGISTRQFSVPEKPYSQTATEPPNFSTFNSYRAFETRPVSGTLRH